MQADYLGKGDLTKFINPFHPMKFTFDFGHYQDVEHEDPEDVEHEHDHKGDDDDFVHCHYQYHVYPSSQFEDEAYGDLPVLAAVCSAAVFFLIALAFFTYDGFVQRRNKKVINAAAKTNAIVLSLFPAHIRDRLVGGVNEGSQTKHKRNGLKGFLDEAGYDNHEGGSNPSNKPIAELFPSTTVMFGTVLFSQNRNCIAGNILTLKSEFLLLTCSRHCRLHCMVRKN